MEDCLLPNHMLFRRSLKLFDPDQQSSKIFPSKKFIFGIGGERNAWLV